MAVIKASGVDVLVDDSDLAKISKHKWWLTKAGYVYTQTCHKTVRTTIMLHRYLTDVPKGMEVDHINHNKLDNRLSNLRICTRSQNNANMRPRTGYKGVRFTRNGWQAETKIDGKYVYIGRYKTAEEAAHAYNIKAKELFGGYSFANDLTGRELTYIQTNQPKEGQYGVA